MHYFTNNKFDNLIIILFSILPISILFGNFLINLTTITIGFLFLIKLIKNRSYFFNSKDNNYLFFLLLFFFLSLVVNLIFTNDINLSYPRVLKFFFIIFYILAFKFLVLNYYENIKEIYKIWSLIFLIVIVDLIFELYFGKNILGYTSIMKGRLGSFTGQEGVIGNFFLGFCLIFLSFFYSHSQNKFWNISLAIFLIIISLLIGERANFIKTLIAILIFIFFIYKIDIKIKIFSIILALILVYSLINFSHFYKWRYLQLDKVNILLTKNGLTKYLDNSQYGAHRNVAKEIFLDNPIFGVGIKNFRVESRNEKYNNLDHKLNHLRVSNHPHELYYEFLSETGIFGLGCFIILIFFSVGLAIKNYFKNKNTYQFSAIIIILLSILPVIPTGSFLATYTSSIFWINYAIMMGYCFKKN